MHPFIHLHETEVPIMLEGATLPVGYRVITKDFDFSAIYETDGTVNVYVEWGDDQGGDMANHPSMAEAKRHLDTLIKACEPKAPTVKIDLSKAVKESVDEGLKKAGLPDTTYNRIQILNSMHSRLVSEEPSTHAIRPVLIAIEDWIIALDDSE